MTNEQIVNQIIEERTAEALADCKGDRASAYAYVIGQLHVMLATAADLAMTHNHKDARGYLLSQLRESPQGRAEIKQYYKINHNKMGYGIGS